MTYEFIQVEKDNHVTTVTINRPERMNAVHPYTAIEMHNAFNEFEADEYACKFAKAQDLKQSLVKLYRDNASTLTPDPLHSSFYDSHPPALLRIQAIDRL